MDIFEEARILCEEILKNIELDELPLHSIVLKASRVARILKDSDMQMILQQEASGYPSTPTGVPAEAFRLAKIANRVSKYKDKETSEVKESCYTQSIQEIEATIDAEQASLKACGPNLVGPRRQHQYSIQSWTGRLASRRALVHGYVADQLTELVFSNLADTVFTRIRLDVDARIASLVPESVRKFSAIHDNLKSDNPEDWSNCAHSCRRILQDLADVLFPTTTDRVASNGKKIKLGNDNYINRLVCFAEDRSESTTFSGVVGSHLGYLGDRLDALFVAAQKGSHNTISSREEADRYVVYTYMIVGDLLQLVKE